MLFRVEVLQAIADERPRRDCSSAEYGKLLTYLTGEEKIYSFQLPSLEAECKKHILGKYPNIMAMEGSVELDPIPNRIKGNPNAEIEKKGYDGSIYLNIIPPIYTAS